MSSSKKTTTDFLSKLDAFFDKRWKIILGISGFFILSFGLFLFDAKMSVGGDDSAYIMRAIKFLSEGKFPSFQGALYPLFLSVFVAVFGVNVMLFKWFSFAATFAWVFLFYKTFKNRIPSSILGFSLLILTINSYLLYYASQTYNEAFFLLIEMGFIYYFLKHFDSSFETNISKKATIKGWVLNGFWIFLVIITKNAGLAILIASIIFLLWHKKWVSTLYYVGSYIVCTGIYNLLKRFLFAQEGTQISKQGNILLLKDPYNHAKGNEDLMGFVNRFVQNSHLYISKHFPKMLGFRDVNVTTTTEWLTYLILVLFLTFLVLAIKNKNKTLLFLGLYNGCVLGVTFIILQTRWDQDRLIILVFPFLVVYFLYGFYELFKLASWKKFQSLFLLLMVLTFFLGASDTWVKSKENILVFKRNLSGDKYYGYSPDWQNYLQMCEWAGKNLPDSNVVMVRKPSMATIFGEKTIFYGLYRLPTTNADTLVKFMKDKNITHVIMANLRKNPKINSGFTINTIQRALTMYSSKNIIGLQLIHQIGQNEPAYLFKLIDSKAQLSTDATIRALTANVIVNPKVPYFSYNLGNAQMQAKQYSAAAISYTKAINNSKEKSFESYFNRGIAYLNSGQWNGAISDFTTTLKLNPTYAQAYYNLGIAYLNTSKKGKARVAMQKAENLGFSISAEIQNQLN